MKGAVNASANAVIITLANEGAVGITGTIADPSDFSAVHIHGSVILTLGTAAASIIVKLRRGLLVTSPLVATGPTLTGLPAAGSQITVSYDFVDQPPGGVDELQYTVTVTVGSATGNSTVNFFCGAVNAMP